jgi:Rod binding domain-containing protein
MSESIPSVGNPTPARPVLPDAFDQFVGDTFFRQMLKSMRSGSGKPAFLHGGQAEEIFQSQLDEVIITDLAQATKDSFSAELFKQQFQKHQFPDPTESTTAQSTDADSNAAKPDSPPLAPLPPTPETRNFDANA